MGSVFDSKGFISKYSGIRTYEIRSAQPLPKWEISATLDERLAAARTIIKEQPTTSGRLGRQAHFSMLHSGKVYAGCGGESVMAVREKCDEKTGLPGRENTELAAFGEAHSFAQNANERGTRHHWSTHHCSRFIAQRIIVRRIIAQNNRWGTVQRYMFRSHTPTKLR